MAVSSGMGYRDYVFKTRLKRDGFQAIPDAINYKDRQLMEMVEGKKSHCLSCKQVGHLVKSCPQKTEAINQQTLRPRTATAEGVADAALGPKLNNPPNQE